MTSAIRTDALKGRVALVTGGSKNLGRAISVGLAEAGADVAVAGFSSPAEVEETVAMVKAAGRKAVGLLGDVSSAADVERMVGEATAALGPIDILVSNASQRPRRAFVDLTVE